MFSEGKCRLCLSENSLFTNLTDVRDGLPISVIVMIVCPVKVEQDDSLPKQVCDECLEIVLSAYKLRDLSILSDLSLRGSTRVQCYKTRKGHNKIAIVDPLIKQEPLDDNDTAIVHKEPESPRHPLSESDDDFYFESSSVELITEPEPSTRGLKRSRAKQPQELICHVCSEKFQYEKFLRKHLTMHGEKEISCKICPAQFFFLRALKRHMRIHDPKHRLRYQCDKCDKYFSWKRTLITHMHKAHLETQLEKKYQCKVCKARFHENYHLKVHMVIHTGEVRSRFHPF
jgi:Zinc-finger associated domain (zf-AD)